MYVKIKVKTDQRAESIVEKTGHLEVSVKQPAKQNLANLRILALIKIHFKTGKVRLVSGHHSSSKIVSVG